MTEGPKITPLTTGTVRLKAAMARGRVPGRQLRLFAPGPFGPPLPIHAWLVEHAGRVLLVDTGHHEGALDSAFARFAVTPEDHLDAQLARAGVQPRDITQIVLTHVHPDHADGLRFLPGVPVLVSEAELGLVRSPPSAIIRLVTRSPLPPVFAPTTFRFEDGPIGAFPASHRLTPDGVVRAVPAPGHTPGHTAVLIDAGDHDVLLGGDIAYDQQQLLDLHPDGVSQSFAVARETMQRVLDHARVRPTVFLPSHDRESVARLQGRTTIPSSANATETSASPARPSIQGGVEDHSSAPWRRVARHRPLLVRCTGGLHGDLSADPRCRPRRLAAPPPHLGHGPICRRACRPPRRRALHQRRRRRRQLRGEPRRSPHDVVER